MKNSYINILIDSLEDKEKVLDEILLADKEQEELFKAENVDLDAINDSQEKIGRLAAKLDKLNDGFQSVYDRVRVELQNNKEQYKNEILRMQELITSITGKSVKIEAEQNRNKVKAENLFKEKRRELMAKRSTVRKVSIYANQMHGITPSGHVESAFLDKKK